MTRRLFFGRHTRRLGWREAIDGWLFILPWLVGFLALTAGPMIASAIMSFTKWDVLTRPQWVGFGKSEVDGFVKTENWPCLR